MSLTTRVVTWDFTDAGQAALTGSVTFTPSQLLTDPSGDLTIAPSVLTFRYSGGAGQSVPLVTTDNASVQQQGWWYSVTVQWGDSPAWPPPSYTFNAFLPSGSGTIDLSDLTPLVSPQAMDSYLPTSGGTLTGPLLLAADPAVPLGAATKEYVDASAGGGGAVTSVNGQAGTVVLDASQVGADTSGAAAAAQTAAETFATSAVAAETSRAETAETAVSAAVTAETSRAEAAEALALPLAGGTMSGPVAMGSQKITGLAAGTATADAARFGQLPSALSPLPLTQGGTGTSAASGDALLAALGGAALDGAAFTGEVTVPDPVNPSDAATKAYADAVSQGLSIKPSVQEATTGPLPASTYSAGVLTASANGALSVDGVAPGTGDRILVKNETAQANNGIYVVTQPGDAGTPWILTRASDMDTGTQVPGAFAFTTDGTVNIGAGFVVTGRGTFTIGTTPVIWTQFSGAGEITAGTGLAKAGNTISLTVPVPLTSGGTGQTAQPAALTALTGAQAAGSYVRSDGTNAALSPIQAADLPSLDQVPAPAADVSLNSRKITNLANGTAPQDAAAFGQIPAALPPSGTASGDLSGNYPDPAVAAVRGVAVSVTAPTAGQVLTAASASTAGWAPPVPAGTAGGDLGSAYPNPTVTATHLASPLPAAQGGTGAATLTGLVKGNGTSPFTAAAAGTDYAPPTATTSALKGNGSGGFAAATLNDVGAPAADYSLNSRKITNLANGSASTDAATLGQIPVLDSVTADIAPVGVQSAGTSTSAARADHVHATAAPLYNLLAPAGATAETFPRAMAAVVSYPALTSGTLYVRAIALPKGAVVSNLTFIVGNTVEAGGTHGWYVLLDANRVVRAVTADQTGAAFFTGTNTPVTLAAASPYTVPAAGLYYVGVCVTAGTMPTFECGTPTDSNIIGVKVTPVLMGLSSAGQTTPPSAGTTMGAITANGSPNFYAYTS